MMHQLGLRVKQALVHGLCPREPFYVISHERSGTHFTVNNILKNAVVKQHWHNIGEWFGPYHDSCHRFEHIDAFNRNWDQAWRQGCVIKSHCDHDLFEARYHPAPVIYVMRDPRDTLTSWFHYLNHDDFYRYNPKVEDMRCDDFFTFLRRPLPAFLQNSYALESDTRDIAGRWARHVAGWISAPDTLVVRYEELARDFVRVLHRIRDHTGIRLKPGLKPVRMNDSPSVLPRKGMIGDWQQLFSESDQDFLRNRVEAAGLDWNNVCNPGDTA